ncbi:hypothetical protein PACTADRAFT_34668 [Pachysolen tannophilus NRRL Y-2460]|uniref:Sec20 C-terminal domain-containing protein n=1 Tax=Pachysolen tannophilus NRRL Y-2460 TaxID=669874 RepID=A0A1E4TTB2_PACTA|nr:hypothetical protein PACTADRAFT_34668 [Pachysolen tannophilus NRRL Y-2460]
MDLSIAENFNQIKSLNEQILYAIFKLKNNNVDEENRLKLVNKSLSLVKSFKDLLFLNEFKINQLPHHDINYLTQLSKYKEAFDDLKIELRIAQLQSYENEKLHLNKQRNMFLQNAFTTGNVEESSLTEEEARNKLFHYNPDSFAEKRTQDELLLDKNKEVTSQLFRTRQLMEASLLQSDLNLEGFKESTRSLQNLNMKFESFNDFISTTKKLIITLNKLSSKEKMQIKYSLWFFISCCSYVLIKRLFGFTSKIYWLISLPFRIIFFPLRFLLWILRFFISTRSSLNEPLTEAIDNFDNFLELTNDVIMQATNTVTNVLTDATMTVSDVVIETLSSASSTGSEFDGLNESLSSILYGDATGTTSKIISKATGRIVDEL